jgi:hypothetical protein
MYLLIFKKGIVAVQSIVTFIKRLTRMCHQSLHCCFIDWTKPDTTSLMLGTLTDLTRRKSKLMAENALLRKPLINLRREVIQPTCTKTDRMFPALLAKAVRTWKQALVIVREADASQLASSENGFQCSAAVAVQLLYKGNDKNHSSLLYPCLSDDGCDYSHIFAVSWMHKSAVKCFSQAQN